MGVFLAWICLSLLVGVVGRNRNCGFATSFFASLILSPIIGLVITLLFKKKLTQTEMLQKAKILLDSGVITPLEHGKMVEDIMVNNRLRDIDKYRN